MTSPSIEKPSVDERQYRHFTLGEEMDVLLISDPDTDKASAACDVYVGQLCDTLPGLAHFCEHMLFIGTEKYPTENAYDQYLSTHGGSSNAFTDLEHTCYYFDVQAESLEGALDRFAQCFIGPLFTQSALEREVQAVDSEHAKNIQQDPWRMYQLSKSQIGDPSHMFASFGTGNQESLPKENIREKVLDFYQRYYRRSLSLYKLVVLGKESLDDLEKMVHSYFDDLVKTFEQDGKEEKKQDRGEILKEIYPAMPSWQVPKRLNVVPVAQVHSVDIMFPLPPTLSMYKYKPTRYLSHLIGHEGNGSLLSCLKALNYAQELYSDDQSVSCTPWSIFSIRLELTELGLTNIDNVVAIVFAYIDLLREKGPQEWIQDELKTVGDLQFKFLSKRNPMDYTCSLAGWMQHYAPEHYLSGAYKLYDWDPNAVTECLSALTPNNMLMIVSSPTLAGSTSSTCPWYTTQYEQIDVDQTLWERWSAAKHSDFEALAFPQINDMIATEFDVLKSHDLPKNMPRCILNTKSLLLWYKPDNVFDMPKVNIMLNFTSKPSMSSPEASVAISLFAKVVEEQCNEFTYLASMASLHSDISATSTGLEVQVSGYNHKAHILVARVIDTLTGLSAIDPEIFSRIHTKLEQQYDAFLVSQPYQHAIHGGDLCLENAKFTVFEKICALKNISLDEVLQASKSFLKHCKIDALVHGNVTADHAKEMAEMVLNKVKGESFDESNTYSSLERRVVHLPLGSCLYRFPEYNDANTNSCSQIIFQMGATTLEDNATLAFLHHLIREPAFNQLRTEEQLGYIVHTSVKTSGDNIKNLLFLIQSDSFDPIHVESRVEEFIAKFRERITSMTQEDFETNVEAVVQSFLEKNKNLGEESSRYWHVILNQTYHFTRLQELAEYVKVMTKDRVLVFFDEYVAASAPSRRKLSIQVFAKQHEEHINDKVGDDVILIKNPEEFKRTMPLFPLPKKVEIEVQGSDTEIKE